MAAPHALAALGQPTRLEIFRLLVRKEPTGLCAGGLAKAVGCPHNTLSTHIAILARAGLVKGRREGPTIAYRADAVGMSALVAFLVTDCCDGHPELCGLPGPQHEAECDCPPTSTQKKKRRRYRVMPLKCSPRVPVFSGKNGADAHAIAVVWRESINTRNKGEAAMAWTVTNLVIQIIAGIIGGHAAAMASKEHSFGALGHTIAGAVGGAVSGYFLQTIVGIVVTSTGEVQQDSDLVTRWILQGLAGLVAGAIFTLAVGFLKHSIDQHRMGKL